MRDALLMPRHCIDRKPLHGCRPISGIELGTPNTFAHYLNPLNIAPLLSLGSKFSTTLRSREIRVQTTNSERHFTRSNALSAGIFIEFFCRQFTDCMAAPAEAFVKLVRRHNRRM